jgi:hypothetical protein
VDTTQTWMVEYWNDHGLHLWFGQCSKFDPCQRRLEQPLTWRSYSVILCPRQTSTSTSSTSTSSTFWENVGTSPSFCSAWFTPPFFLVNPSGWRRKEPTCEGCQNASLASPASYGRNADSMQQRVEVHQKKIMGISWEYM